MFKLGLLGLIFLVPAISGYASYGPNQGKGLKIWNDFRVRYDPSKSNGFYSMPTSIRDRLLHDYVKVETSIPFPVETYCQPHDPRVCLMYDRSGNIAGIQVSLIENDLPGNSTKFPYDYSKVPIYQKSYIFNVAAWAVRIWFTNPEKLTLAGRRNTRETAEGIFFYMGKRLVELSRRNPGTEVHQGFVKQGCTDGMGLHYHYNFDEKTKCEDAVTVFGLYHCDSLIGIGVGGFGRQTAYKTPWFENPPPEGMSSHTPKMPPCLLNWVKNYGMTTLHTYLVKEPWAFKCNRCN